MRKRGLGVFLLVAGFLVLLNLSVQAGPFLICDPPIPEEQVTSYDVELDGVIIAEKHPAKADGSLGFDMIGTPMGNHTVRIRARNLWSETAEGGPSEWSDPLGYSAGVPSKSGGLRLSAEEGE